MVAAVVLDASVPLELLLPDTVARRTLTADLLEQIGARTVTAHVPLIFFNEVAAACARAVRSGRASRPDAQTFLRRLGQVPLQLSVDIAPASAWFDRALRWHCQVADGAYLSLALDLKVPIATFDSGLATAASSNKARLYFAG